MCLLHPIGLGIDTVEKSWPVKTCFQSSRDSMVDLYHGHTDSPAAYDEQDAIDAGFDQRMAWQYTVKHYKIINSDVEVPYWRMERTCLSQQGTLPTGITCIHSIAPI